MKKVFLVLALLFFCSCSNKIPELKSPCVSGNAFADPCGPKRNVNEEWIKHYYKAGVNV
jgi:hypothetical protein